MGSAEQQCARTDARNRVSLMGRGGFEAPKSYRVHESSQSLLWPALARKSVSKGEKVSSKPVCGFEIKDKHTLASGVLCGNVAPALWPAWGV
jgi:hypothetical protein